MSILLSPCSVVCSVSRPISALLPSLLAVKNSCTLSVLYFVTITTSVQNSIHQVTAYICVIGLTDCGIITRLYYCVNALIVSVMVLVFAIKVF